MNNQLSLRKILLSLVGFVFLWAVVTDAWGYSDCCFPFDNGDYLYAYLSRLIWVLPAIYLIIQYGKNWYLNKKWFIQPCFNKSLMVALTITPLYVIGSMLIKHKGFWFNRDVNLPLEVLKYIKLGLWKKLFSEDGDIMRCQK